MQKSISGVMPAVKPGLFIPKRELAVWLVSGFGFFIGRTMVFSFVNPLCVPFLVSFIGTGKAPHHFYHFLVFIRIRIRIGL